MLFRSPPTTGMSLFTWGISNNGLNCFVLICSQFCLFQSLPLVTPLIGLYIQIIICELNYSEKGNSRSHSCKHLYQNIEGKNIISYVKNRIRAYGRKITYRMAGQLNGRVLAQGLISLQFKPLPWNSAVEMSSSLTSNSCCSYQHHAMEVL